MFHLSLEQNLFKENNQGLAEHNFYTLIINVPLKIYENERERQLPISNTNRSRPRFDLLKKKNGNLKNIFNTVSFWFRTISSTRIDGLTWRKSENRTTCHLICLKKERKKTLSTGICLKDSIGCANVNWVNAGACIIGQQMLRMSDQMLQLLED